MHGHANAVLPPAGSGAAAGAAEEEWVLPQRNALQLEPKAGVPAGVFIASRLRMYAGGDPRIKTAVA